MNSSEVAKLLGVSVSTIQRWVKQLELPMERNERGHYLFKEEDIHMLKEIHDQLQNGVLLQDITPVKDKKQTRKGTVKTAENDQAMDMLNERVKVLEQGLHTKADSVASYQLLQHRRELEELQELVSHMSKQIEQLQTEINMLKKPDQPEKPYVLDHGKVKRKKKNFVSTLFGF
ncbi:MULTISPECIES: MerR family transcriptional regulator [Bacillaceae]|uniref:MerR family transcriptional regulator n=1 Tax=Bacillaceae TaxID=186817 RepID=UPI0030008E6C